MTAAVLTERLLFERPIKVEVDGSEFGWFCRSCHAAKLGVRPPICCGLAPTIADAVDAALAHWSSGYCPEASAAARRLIEAIYLVPDYRGPIAVLDDGSGLYACSRCSAYVTDRGEHTDFHLAGHTFL